MGKMLKLQNIKTGAIRYYPVDDETLIQVGETIRLLEEGEMECRIYKILSIAFVQLKQLPSYSPDKDAFNEFIEYSLANVGKKLTYEDYKKFKKEKK